MLSAPTHDVTYGDDDWVVPPAKLYRAASVGNSWGVTSFGRGFNWGQKKDCVEAASQDKELSFRATEDTDDSHFSQQNSGPANSELKDPIPPSTTMPPAHRSTSLSLLPLAGPKVDIPPLFSSPSASPRLTPSSSHTNLTSIPRSPIPRSPTSPYPRRRSSQRVSLIAGQVSIAPMEPPSPPPVLAPSLQRAGSTGSFLSVAMSIGPPTPTRESFLGGRNILEFSIESEIGRGAYGLVKRAREIQEDGSLGPPLVIKQIIKSRILADCWKKHPKYGTIPTEIYVMSAISSTSYILPPRRPWDPSRIPPTNSVLTNGADHDVTRELDTNSGDSWPTGKMVKGHPNICPLLDFFEDNHYYHLVLPSTLPEQAPGEPLPPSDLFDLIENYPQGLPPSSVRSYLGQIADALAFLHEHGIVHRDVKDENVVLGPDGKCILIDFGSSGLVKKGGWDTFSGTLDYAGPEILRGERYLGKPQDVWAYGVVAYVLLVGECPFMTASEAQDGLVSPFAKASIALDERCMEGKEKEGEEQDGGGCLGDAAALVRACLEVEVDARPTFEKILQCQFLSGLGGWGMEHS